jgi:hypothetical protein
VDKNIIDRLMSFFEIGKKEEDRTPRKPWEIKKAALWGGLVSSFSARYLVLQK